MHVSGIPTVGPRGIQFRSRLEAQWAHVFDRLGWSWEYEPFDLYGYIPDFVVSAQGRQVLVEIKGTVDIWRSCLAAEEKIRRSVWTGEYAVVGATHRRSDVGIWGSCGRRLPARHLHVRKRRGVWMMEALLESPEDADVDAEDANVEFDRIWVWAKNTVQWKRPAEAGSDNMRIVAVLSFLAGFIVCIFLMDMMK